MYTYIYIIHINYVYHMYCSEEFKESAWEKLPGSALGKKILHFFFVKIIIIIFLNFCLHFFCSAQCTYIYIYMNIYKHI